MQDAVLPKPGSGILDASLIMSDQNLAKLVQSDMTLAEKGLYLKTASVIKMKPRDTKPEKKVHCSTMRFMQCSTIQEITQ